MRLAQPLISRLHANQLGMYELPLLSGARCLQTACAQIVMVLLCEVLTGVAVV